MNAALKLSKDARIRASQSQVSTDLDGETVILHLDQGLYYGLNPVGARIWSLIQEPRSLDQIIETLLAEYEVTAQTCREEVLALLEDLASNGLIEVMDVNLE